MSHPDGNREIRAMTVAALPFPPLPLMVSKELEGEQSFVAGDGGVASSHDLIAHLMNVACAVASASVNAERMKRQAEIVEKLFERVDAWQDEHDSTHSLSIIPDEEWCLKTAMDFTRLYIGCYMPSESTKNALDLRFIPASGVDKKHKVYIMALQYQRAQDVLYGPSTSNKMQLGNMTFAQLVQHGFRRMLECRSSSLSLHQMEMLD